MFATAIPGLDLLAAVMLVDHECNVMYANEPSRGISFQLSARQLTGRTLGEFHRRRPADPPHSVSRASRRKLPDTICSFP